jgi:hypothetical protein
VLATTGAALPVGEELRPTGTDRALLARLALITGGKVRSTLAGIFQERDLSRRAHQNLDFLWFVLGASALLASVAARRLSVPIPKFLRRTAARAETPANLPTETEAAPGTLAALRTARKRSALPSRDPSAALAVPPAPAPEAHATRSPHTAPAARTRSSPAKPRAAAAKPQSAAEILLERRRRRERGP